MLVAAAVCPHPPLIVPELAGAAAPELDALRSACTVAIRSLLASKPRLLVVVGTAEHSATYPGNAAGTMSPWGVDVRVGEGTPVLPLSLTVARWLLETAFPAEDLPPLRFEAVAADASPDDCAALGREVAAAADDVAVLAMGDGSAKLTEKSPGYLHPLAVPYDASLGRALADADGGFLAQLDPSEAEELWVGGRAAFQVLAGAAAAADFVGEPLYDDAPYGVGYFVARWSREEAHGERLA
ncbi:hypothetical protein Pth03_34570 [Planotetraspora thailandica]|uniref:Extradiol ring-cleavage dioxygenase class III enzyme subunit B domain-containing protein n=1 Tax=Planotetraspora thailandica TaxID=487172 RepID=A0A8J3XYV6_9ACTN|nr:hypothetical protein [Planotetraspora thailandica]GII55068.1 hypothetical protein Pth03_34570 [Planotetraspora thailandica]